MGRGFRRLITPEPAENYSQEIRQETSAKVCVSELAPFRISEWAFELEHSSMNENLCDEAALFGLVAARCAQAGALGHYKPGYPIDAVDWLKGLPPGMIASHALADVALALLGDPAYWDDRPADEWEEFSSQVIELKNSVITWETEKLNSTPRSPQ